MTNLGGGLALLKHSSPSDYDIYYIVDNLTAFLRVNVKSYYHEKTGR